MEPQNWPLRWCDLIPGCVIFGEPLIPAEPVDIVTEFVRRGNLVVIMYG